MKNGISLAAWGITGLIFCLLVLTVIFVVPPVIKFVDNRLSGSRDNTGSIAQEQQQGADVKKAPENMEPAEETGTSIDPSFTGIVKYYSGSTSLVEVSGVYPNGDKGYSCVVLASDITGDIDVNKEYGVAGKDKMLYVNRKVADRFNPRLKEHEFGLGSQDNDDWGFTKAGITSVGGVEFYTLRLNQLTMHKNKHDQVYYRFNGWYMGSNKFFPHEAQKKGHYKAVDNIVR